MLYEFIIQFEPPCQLTYTPKLNNHTIPNKGSPVIYSPASTFEGLFKVQRNRFGKQNTIKTKLKV